MVICHKPFIKLLLLTLSFMLSGCGSGGNGGDQSDVGTGSGPDTSIPSSLVTFTQEDEALLIAALTPPAGYDVVIHSNPGLGTVDTPAGMAPTYTPNPNVFGTDTFSFRFENEGIVSNITTVFVSIIPVNDAPTASSFSESIDEDTSLHTTLQVDDVDLDTLSISITDTPDHGTYTLVDDALTYTPAANYFGTDSISYTVTDGIDTSSQATLSITITGTPDNPVAQDLSFTCPEDHPLNKQLLGADVDMDSLTYEILSAPANGLLTLPDANNPDFTYTPNAHYAGADQFLYRVHDGSTWSAAGTVDIQVLPINDKPVVPALNESTNEDMALVINLAGTDVENSPLTYFVASYPSHGSISTSGNTFTYTPHEHYNGTDQLTYRCYDGQLWSDAQTIAITINPQQDPPVAGNILYGFAEDTTLYMNLNASDVDGDPLTYEIVTAPANGSVSLNGGNNIPVSYTPAANFTGLVTLTYRVHDGHSWSGIGTAQINVSPVNDLPTSADKNVNGTEDTTLVINVTGYDVDGDSLQWQVTQQPTRGSFLSIVGNAFTYQPHSNLHGADSFKFRVYDGTGYSSEHTVSIQISPVNDKPFANNLSTWTHPDTAVQIDLSGGDVDGDAITWRIDNDVSHGSLSWIDADTLEYTPDSAYAGPDSFSVISNDSQLDSNAATISIQVEDMDTIIDFEQAWIYNFFGTDLGKHGLAIGDFSGTGNEQILLTHNNGAGYFWSVLDNLGTDYAMVHTQHETQAIRTILVHRPDGSSVDYIFVALDFGTINIYRGDTWNLVTTLNTDNAYTLQAVDADNDNDIELLVAGYNFLTLFDMETLTFQQTFHTEFNASAIAGDVDGDNLVEIILHTGEVIRIESNTITTVWDYGSNFGYKMHLSDFDEDNKLELIASQGWDEISIYDIDQKSKRASIDTSHDIGAIEVFDIDGDDIDELFYGDGQHGDIHCIDLTTMTERWFIDNPKHGTTDIVLGDPDDDGDLEIVWGAGHTSSGSDHLYVNDIDTGANEWKNMHLDGPVRALATGDLDDDGNDEILAVSFGSNSGYDDGTILIFDAATKVLEHALSDQLGGHAWTGVHDAVIGDIDGDEETEFLIATDKLYDGAIYIFDGASRVLERRIDLDDGSPIYRLALGDTDNDNEMEIIAAAGKEHTGSPGTFIYRIDGATGVTEWTSAALSSGWSDSYGIVLADVTGSDNLDIVVSNVHMYIVDGELDTMTRSTDSNYFGLTATAYPGQSKDVIFCGRQNGQITIVDKDFQVIDTLNMHSDNGNVTAIAINDINNDGLDEVISTANGHLSVMRLSNRALLHDDVFIHWGFGDYNALEVTDRNNDGQLEILGGFRGGLIELQGNEIIGIN